MNPWKLMQWMGHKRIDETMLYVHFAEAHLRPLTEVLLEAARGQEDPDRKIIAMLGRRGCVANLAKPLSLDREAQGP